MLPPRLHAAGPALRALALCLALSAHTPPILAAVPGGTIDQALLLRSGDRASEVPDPDPVVPLRVLFLGDDGPHRPAERFQGLRTNLAPRSVELDYTASPGDLHGAKLAGYDALILYADHPRLGPDQEQALLGFVEAGGGLVAVHRAVSCFTNSARFTGLVGARSDAGDTRALREFFVLRDHPILDGLTPIESWDAPRVGTVMAADAKVLAERREGERREPTAWVREQGKGRVFGTAWGHDDRTWGHPGFQALLERGLRWAAATSRNRLTRHAGLAPLREVDAPAPLPNYVVSSRWGVQGDPITTMQEPLAPRRSEERWVGLDGFRVQLFASEPEVVKPIWLAWDERGRLWIAETVDYPNDLRPLGEGNDRLTICEDLDGNGVADTFTVFADKLSIPTGFVFARGGVIVLHSGRTEWLRDTDGDDRADERQVLFEGWGMNDTHATASNLRYGFDNWIWGTVGYSGFRGSVGGRELRFGQGIFRFKPDGSALEFVRSSNNNTWGLGLSEDGLIFGSTANGNATMYMPIPNRFYEAVLGWSAARLETIADSQRFYPITDKVRQVDYHGRYTAGSGSALYTARDFPAEYWNRVQFVAEPTGHLIGKFHLAARGADFVSHNGRNFLASDDAWSSPVVAEVGPDGALWMSDWYNYIIQHNPTPQGFQNGKGNAYETPLRDKVHGRIYRVTHRGARHARPAALDPARPASLVAALGHENLLWRLHAQRLLVERGGRDVVPALRDRVRDRSVDAIGLNPAAIHALWTLHGLGALDGGDAATLSTTMEALRHPTPGVRRAAVTVLPRNESSLAAVLEAGLLKDPDAQVRLATLLAVSEMPVSEAAGAAVAAVAAMADGPAIAGDRWLVDAATAAGARHDVGFLRTALAPHRAPAGRGAMPATAPGAEASAGWERLVRTVTGHYARRGPVDTILPTVMALKDAAPALCEWVLEALVAGWPEGQTPAVGPGDREALLAVMRVIPESNRDRVLLLSRRWGLPDLFAAEFAAVLDGLKARLADPAADEALRVQAARRLIGLEDSAEALRLVLQPIGLLSTPGLAGGLVQALSESRHDDAGAVLLGRWADLSPAARRTAIGVLMRRPAWTRALLDAVEEGRMARTDLGVEQWSQLRQSPNRAVARRAERLAAAAGAVSEERREIVERLLPLARQPGSAARGREVYQANCAVCHVFEGAGGKVGPDLTGIAARDRADMLLEVLDPNRSVEANYRMWHVTTRDGEVISGRLDAETQTSIEILDTLGHKHVVQRSNIESLQASSLSIMPAGFEALPEEDLKGLIEYLATPHP